MNIINGGELQSQHEMDCDVVIVGSGPAGAAVARTTAEAGLSVVVVEEGAYHRPQDFHPDSFRAMTNLYRDFSASLLMGNVPMPFVQGRALGGTSVINGAISWRLPKDVYDTWAAADPQWAESISWKQLSAKLDEVEKRLNIHPTPKKISGANNLLLAKGAEALGIEHRPIARNVKNCKGLGLCLQGCPEGNKMSMDRTYLPAASKKGAQIVTSVRIESINREKGRAVGVTGMSSSGATVVIKAKRAVVLAASAVQTPALLLASGIRQGPVGEYFQCHPGASLAGKFKESVNMWTGATQGHEVTGLRHEGLKFEAMGYGLAITAARLKGFGSTLSQEIADLGHWANWGVAVKAEGRGRVRSGRKRARLSFSLTRHDVARVRRGIRFMGEMMLAAGAEYVTPGVPGYRDRVSDRAVMARFEEEAPWNAKAYTMAVTHMFGSCRMGSDPKESVVRPDFRHHHVDALYVADSSVFPSNTGVNPQTSIIALATLCGESIVS